MKIGNREFDLDNRCYVMGILNCTPDSFSDGGKFNDIDRALKHVEEMISDGADIIDIGGESTRPGYTLISDEEEIERVVPVIEKVKANFDIGISVDTYKSQVAKAAVQAGADLINDIWGCKYDRKIADVIAKYDVPCCLMHNRNIEEKPYRSDIMEEMKIDLKECVDIALNAGVGRDKIILDPGIGFGKTLENNLTVMKRVSELKEMGFPLLLGTSRKSMIGLTLNLPAGERVEGTLVTTVMGVRSGCSFVRVHDVKENKRAVMMTEAILMAR